MTSAVASQQLHASVSTGNAQDIAHCGCQETTSTVLQRTVARRYEGDGLHECSVSLMHLQLHSTVGYLATRHVCLPHMRPIHCVSKKRK